MSQPEPSEEELRAAMEEQMRQLAVEDVLMQSIVTFVNLAGRRLGLGGAREELELGQARLAIEATRALMPLAPPDQAAPIRDALSQLQVAYAREAGPGAAPAEPVPGAAEGPGDAAAPAPGDTGEDEAARADARSRIWTPPGS